MPTADGSLYCELRELRAELQAEFNSPVVATRTELNDLRFDLYALRHEFTGGRKELGELRNDIEALRFDLLKWSCAFWIAQVVAVAGLMMSQLTGH